MTEVIEAGTPTLYCGGCGDEVAILDKETNRGPCCHNLPERWARTEEGLYNGPPGESNHEGEDDEDEEYQWPECRRCGSHSFTVTGTQTIDVSHYEEPDGETVSYDAWEADHTMVCAGCGHETPHLRLEST
jgi:ribosomal protein L37E